MQDSNVRRAQIAFLVILGLSASQVVWWIYDQSRYAQTVHENWQKLYDADMVAAVALLDRGTRSESVEELFPHLQVNDGDVSVAPEALAALNEERRAHVNQYVWEGVFFLIVILCGMVVILRAVARDAQLRRWQSNFLAAVSHELKSPLASLQLAAETLELREHSAEQRQRLVGRILADAERLGHTVANVLDTNRLDRQEVHFARQEINLAEAVAQSLAEIDFRARETGVGLHADVAEELSIEADAVGVRAVLRNLLDNAVKAAKRPDPQPHGGAVEASVMRDPESGEVRVVAEANDRGVTLCVSDNGIGFSPEEGARLFEKFYRVGDELRRTQPGSGLGLYTTRRFVELEGGTVTAHSDGLGEGATFTVFWPSAQHKRAPRRGRRQA